jgi:putative phosphoesterase
LKIAILSDTHIPVRLRALPGQVYELCTDADLIIHAGDIEDNDVIDNLLRFAPVKAVKGNMDGFVVSSRFPEMLVLELEGFTVCVSHGSGTAIGIRDRLRKKFQSSNPDIIIHGHTHEFFWKQEKGIWFLNPGAVASPNGHRSAATLTLEKGQTPLVERIVF